MPPSPLVFSGLSYIRAADSSATLPRDFEFYPQPVSFLKFFLKMPPRNATFAQTRSRSASKPHNRTATFPAHRFPHCLSHPSMPSNSESLTSAQIKHVLRLHYIENKDSTLIQYTSTAFYFNSQSRRDISFSFQSPVSVWIAETKVTTKGYM